MQLKPLKKKIPSARKRITEEDKIKTIKLTDTINNLINSKGSANLAGVYVDKPLEPDISQKDKKNAFKSYAYNIIFN